MDAETVLKENEEKFQLSLDELKKLYNLKDDDPGLQSFEEISNIGIKPKNEGDELSVSHAFFNPIDWNIFGDDTDDFDSNEEQMKVEIHWWGFDLVLNDKMTRNIITGTTAGGTLAALLTSVLTAAGVITGGVAAIVGFVLGGAIVLKRV